MLLPVAMELLLAPAMLLKGKKTPKGMPKPEDSDFEPCCRQRGRGNSRPPLVLAAVLLQVVARQLKGMGEAMGETMMMTTAMTRTAMGMETEIGIGMETVMAGLVA